MFILNTVTLILALCFGSSSASNIGIFATSGSKSHKIAFTAIIEEMAEKGHTITVFSAFPPKEPKKRIKEIILSAGNPFRKEAMKKLLPGHGGLSVPDYFNLVGSAAELFCREAVETPEVENMLNGKDKYDLIILDQFFDECGVAIANKAKVPFIFVSTSALLGHFANNLRYLYPTVHVPFPMSSFSDTMNFWERLANLLMMATVTYYREFVYIPKMNAALRSLFDDDLPSILEMEKNVSMILLNTHVSLNHPTPYLPHTKEVGGMHLREGRPLPKDLQDWIDGAGPEGVVYFSLGTVLPASEMNDKYRNLFLQTFSKLRQRVVWKWETSEMEGLPDNVKVFKYLPQQDILAHPSTKAFLTHGGLLSLLETIYHGVPIVGIPGGADQFYNMQNAVSRKFGVKLTLKTITGEALLDALRTVIYNPSFKQNVIRVSRIFKDRPSRPIDNAMYWIEFVIRHNGALHLRSSVLDLKWYEYYMVDIAVFLVAILTTALLIHYFTLRFLYKRLCKNRSKPEHLKKTKKA